LKYHFSSPQNWESFLKTVYIIWHFFWVIFLVYIRDF
jgi:hypothetical protein